MVDQPDWRKPTKQIIYLMVPDWTHGMNYCKLTLWFCLLTQDHLLLAGIAFPVPILFFNLISTNEGIGDLHVSLKIKIKYEHVSTKFWAYAALQSRIWANLLFSFLLANLFSYFSNWTISGLVSHWSKSTPVQLYI